MLNIHLFNGSKTKESWNEESPEFIDDWKPESCDIQAENVQVTYRDHIKITQDGDLSLQLFWSEDGFIEHNGVFYGDISIQSLPQITPSHEDAP